MASKLIFSLTLILFLFQSCENEQAPFQNKWATPIPVLPLQRDTINVTDADGLRQGLWVIDNKQGLIEEGTYKDNKREGTWRFIISNINLSKLTYTVLYKNDEPQKLNPDR